MTFSCKQIGVLAILGASIAWAVEPILAKLSYITTGFIQTSATRALFVTIVGLIYCVIRGGGNLKVSPRQLSALFYLAFAGTLFADLMYLLALAHIPVINAVLIGHLQPLFIVIMGFFWLKEDKLTAFDYTGIGFMVLAGLFVTTRNLENLSKLQLGTFYDLLALSATFAWATTGIVARKYLREVNAGTVVFYRFSLSTAVFMIYLLLTSLKIFSNVYQILIGITVGAGYILYYEGLKRIKAAQVSALELSTPFFASLLGFFILGERVTLMQILGIFLLCVGIFFLSAKEKEIE
ncbi:DMT family transporter [Candidatus Aerophobetes bacterium]|nr:DMT family transporter [Candidatus Aerophobetes bacterium]